MSKQVKYPENFDVRDCALMGQEVYGVIEDRAENDLDSGFLGIYQEKASAADGGTKDDPVYVATYRLVKIEAVYVKHTTSVVVEK